MLFPISLQLLLPVFSEKIGLFSNLVPSGLLSLASLFVLVANQFLLFYKPFIRQEPLTYPFFRLFFFNLHTSFFYAIIPLLFIWIGRKQGDFGFTIKGFNYKPYLWMLAIMLPLLIWASYQPDFLRVYPRYKPGTAEEFWNISPFFTVGAFEFSYILQFIFLEWFFRGFMVMKLEKHLAHYAVFPMVAVYCFIHFGKPMAETDWLSFRRIHFGSDCPKIQNSFRRNSYPFGRSIADGIVGFLAENVSFLRRKRKEERTRRAELS